MKKREKTINIEAQLHSDRTRFLESGVAHLFEKGTYGVFSFAAGFVIVLRMLCFLVLA